MAAKLSGVESLKAMRWPQDEWAWLAEVAKSVGVSRSEFVRRSAIGAAKALELGLSPYSVIGAGATTQNTRPNGNGPGLRQQAGAVCGGEGSRTRLAPEGINGPNPEDLGRQGGGWPDERSEA